MAIKISVHTKEETALGKFTSKLPFLSDKEMTDLNSIGYSGTTSSGKRITREEYLNSLGRWIYREKEEEEPVSKLGRATRSRWALPEEEGLVRTLS